VLVLPVSSEEWEHYLGLVKDNKKVRDAYDASVSCTVTFRSPELGKIDLECERAFTPFRWLTKQSNGAYRIQLLQNDTTDKVSVSYAAFSNPQQFAKVEMPVRGDFITHKAGGLYSANRGDASIAVVIPPFSITSFVDLEAQILRLPPVTTPQQLSILASTTKVWCEAQLTGDLISRRKHNAAVVSLRTCLIESLCGGAWVALEENVRQQRKSLDVLAVKLGLMQVSGPARAALAGLVEYFEITPSELADQLLQELRENSSATNTKVRDFPEQTRDFIMTLLRYLRVEDISINPLPPFSLECASFAFNHQWLVRLARFILFAKSVLTRLTPAFSVVGAS
jgi:hypothetical protein